MAHPIFRIIDEYLQVGGRIEKRHGRICLVDENSEYLCGGNNLKELFLNCIWTFCQAYEANNAKEVELN